MKKIRVLLLVLMVVCGIAAVYHARENARVKKWQERYAVSHLADWMKDGEIVRFSDVYPYDWDAVEISGSVIPEATLEAITQFDPNRQLPKSGSYILMIFYKGDEVAGFEAYVPSGTFLFPAFSLWEEADSSQSMRAIRYMREEAVFKCRILGSKRMDRDCWLEKAP